MKELILTSDSTLDVQETSSGQFKIKAIACTPGILEYPGMVFNRPNDVLRMYVPESVVLSEGHISTLKDCIVVDGHPKDGFVSRGNIKKLRMGHVSADYEVIEVNGRKAPKVTLFVDDENLFKSIVTGVKRQVSIGARSRYIIYDAPRETPYGEADGEITSRAVNHLAICKKARDEYADIVDSKDTEEGMEATELLAELMGKLDLVVSKLDEVLKAVTASAASADEDKAEENKEDIEAKVAEVLDSKFVEMYEDRVCLLQAAEKLKVSVKSTDTNQVLLKNVCGSLKLPENMGAVKGYLRGINAANNDRAGNRNTTNTTTTAKPNTVSPVNLM